MCILVITWISFRHDMKQFLCMHTHGLCVNILVVLYYVWLCFNLKNSAPYIFDPESKTSKVRLGNLGSVRGILMTEYFSSIILFLLFETQYYIWKGFLCSNRMHLYLVVEFHSTQLVIKQMLWKDRKSNCEWWIT